MVICLPTLVLYLIHLKQCTMHHCDMQFTSFSLNNDAAVQTVHSFVKCVALNKMGQFGILLWFKLRCTWNWMQFHECNFMNAISSKNLVYVWNSSAISLFIFLYFYIFNIFFHPQYDHYLRLLLPLKTTISPFEKKKNSPLILSGEILPFAMNHSNFYQCFCQLPFCADYGKTSHSFFADCFPRPVAHFFVF